MSGFVIQIFILVLAIKKLGLMTIYNSKFGADDYL